MTVRVALPPHLRTLAGVHGDLTVRFHQTPTMGALLDAVEASYPMLEGTIRNRETGLRRPMIRFFASGEDLSHESLDAPLPDAVASGEDVLHIVGAIAGG